MGTEQAVTAGPNALVIFDWLAALYGNMEGGWLSTLAINRDTGARVSDWYEVADLDGASDRIRDRAETSDVWLGVGTRCERLASGRGGDADTAHFPGLWLDVDIAGPGHKGDHTLPPDEAAAEELVATFPLAPSFVVHSGGGLQAWWLFDEPVDQVAMAGVLPRWHATWSAAAERHGWHLDNVFDLARIMRIPGTVNRKLPEARPVTVLEDPGHAYGLGDLDEWLMDPPEPVAPPAAAREPWTGPERPGDAFNRERSAGDILREYGWALAETERNGDQQWTRPGKDVREGTSATVYAEDGHCTIWSDTVPTMWPTLQCRRPYDAFGLWVHMGHGGNWKTASDELAARGLGTKGRGPEDLSWLPAPTVEAAPPPESDDDPEATPGSSWRPTGVADIIDGGIERPIPDVGYLVDGETALYYSGRVNGLYGESGLGKSWIAVAMADEVLQRVDENGEQTGRVAWIDIEEPAEGILQRLVDIGTPEAAIRERFVHFSPEEPINLAAAMFAALDPAPPALVVIDSTGEALTLEGFGPNNDDEVAIWFRTWARRMAHRWGACVIVIDHVVKDESNRGLFPGGSQRKRAAITGSAFMVEDLGEATALGKGVEGKLRLRCAKDRHGTHRRDKSAAQFILDGTAEPQQWRLAPPGPEVTREQKAEEDLERIMAQVSRQIIMRGEPTDNGGPKRTNMEDLKRVVNVKHERLREAVRRLMEEGYVTAETIGRSHFYASVRPYAGPDDIPVEVCQGA